MGALNTFFNFGSLVYNRSTARSTAATSKTADQLASAERLRELRERGLITYSSTPAAVAAVEERLAAQMRARIELEGNAPPRRPYAGPVAVTVLVVLIAVGGLKDADTRGTTTWLIVSAIFLAACAYWAVTVFRRERERAARLSWAIVVDGQCEWCGNPEPHVVEGEPAHPRVFHAVEIEDGIGY